MGVRGWEWAVAPHLQPLELSRYGVCIHNKWLPFSGVKAESAGKIAGPIQARMMAGVAVAHSNHVYLSKVAGEGNQCVMRMGTTAAVGGTDRRADPAPNDADCRSDLQRSRVPDEKARVRDG